jgi:uncharacterized protein GlcG (DUF336 family)
MSDSLLGRVVGADRDCRYCLGAVLALSLAIAAVAYGLTHNDIVTALGGLLFVPTALLLAGIGLTGGTGRRDTEATESL